MILERVENRKLKRPAKDLTLTTFKVDEPVMIQKLHFSTDETPKLAGKWIGPYQISRVGRNPKVYYVKDELGEERKYPVSVSHIKPFKTRSYPVLQEILETDTQGEEREEISQLPSTIPQPDNSGFQIRSSDTYAPPIDLDIDDIVQRDQFRSSEILDKEMSRALLLSRDAYIDPSTGKTFLKSRMVPKSAVRVRREPRKFQE